jgi:hypothetical protein
MAQQKSNMKQTKTDTKQEVAPYDWSQHQGATGFESTGAEDFGIPYLSICQDGSAEFKKSHKDYALKHIDGIEPGNIFDTRTRQILETPLRVIPAHHVKLYQEWKPRNSGGGFVRSHPNATVLVHTNRNERNEDVLENGNTIITTSYFYVFYWDGTDWKKAILPMTSTQLKKARKWLNVMDTQKAGNGARLPMFANEYLLTTTVENNADGSWYGWVIEHSRTLSGADKMVIDLAAQASQEVASSRLMLAESSES